MKPLSVVLATYNEEKNLGECLKSVKDIASEIVIIDGFSTDGTQKVAREYGARIVKTKNYPIFHINKQIALEEAQREWILQLDADERVSPDLAQEVQKVIKMTNSQIGEYQLKLTNRNLFLRHQALVEKRDGKIGTEGEYAGFFVPRLNYFLGKFLKFGGVYPDGVIRLVKKGKARFPAKSVHEQIVVDGKIGWLQNPLLHIDSPTFSRYLERNSRYVDLIKDELKHGKVGKDPLIFFDYFLIKPVWWFFKTQIRHKGILDGWQGVVFSFFSALRFPRAYWRYLND